MITSRRSLTLTLAALPFGVTKTGAAQAQSYPTKPIRFVVPFPPGGSTDVGARLIAENLSRAFGQQVYIENKSGANGTIGIEDAAKSAPDGYTILVTTDTVLSNPQGFRMTAHRDDSACTRAVVRNPPMKETALGERGAVPRALIYRGLTLAAAVICQHNFCVMARTLLMVENSFCIMCNFKELRVAKITHISTSALCA